MICVTMSAPGNRTRVSGKAAGKPGAQLAHVVRGLWGAGLPSSALRITITPIVHAESGGVRSIGETQIVASAPASRCCRRSSGGFPCSGMTITDLVLDSLEDAFGRPRCACRPERGPELDLGPPSSMGKKSPADDMNRRPADAMTGRRTGMKKRRVSMRQQIDHSPCAIRSNPRYKPWCS